MCWENVIVGSETEERKSTTEKKLCFHASTERKFMRFVIETGGNEENMCVGSLHDQKGKC